MMKGFCMSLQVSEIEFSKLSRLCQSSPLAFHFYGYLSQKTPHAKACVAQNDEGEIFGVLANGRSTGNFEFFYDWMWAQSKEAVDLLTRRYLKNVEGEKFPRGLWFDLEHRDTVEAALGNGWKTTFDQMLILTPKQLKEHPLPEGVEFLQLNANNFDQFKIHEVIAPSLGNGNAVKKNGMTFSAAVKNGTVVGVAEATVRFRNVASVQQVHCIPELIGKGIGTSVVSRLCLEIFGEGIEVATYIAAELNPASIRLAQKVGFELHTRLGFAELV